MKKEHGKVAANALCRLGNQMFIAAASRTYAAKTGREFIGLTKTKVKSDFPEYQLKTVMRNVPWIDRNEIVNFECFGGKQWLCNGFPNTDTPNVYFDGFFQDSRCIDKGVAYDLFKPYDSILRKIKELYGDLCDFVCVNVRRGDYLQNGNQELGFNVYSKEEIEAIISTFFLNDKIFFVSDDIKWCKDNFHGDKFMFADKHENLSSAEKAEIDLYLQTQCKANVISNSTFSWWGAFLNDKAERVVCHWPWFKPGKINEMKYILPEEWIKFEYNV